MRTKPSWRKMLVKHCSRNGKSVVLGLEMSGELVGLGLGGSGMPWNMLGRARMMHVVTAAIDE